LEIRDIFVLRRSAGFLHASSVTVLNPGSFTSSQRTHLRRRQAADQAGVQVVEFLVAPVELRSIAIFDSGHDAFGGLAGLQACRIGIGSGPLSGLRGGWSGSNVPDEEGDGGTRQQSWPAKAPTKLDAIHSASSLPTKLHPLRFDSLFTVSVLRQGRQRAGFWQQN
jgi:hypothetical protein